MNGLNISQFYYKLYLPSIFFPDLKTHIFGLCAIARANNFLVLDVIFKS